MTVISQARSHCTTKDSNAEAANALAIYYFLLFAPPRSETSRYEDMTAGGAEASSQGMGTELINLSTGQVGRNLSTPEVGELLCLIRILPMLLQHCTN